MLGSRCLCIGCITFCSSLVSFLQLISHLIHELKLFRISKYGDQCNIATVSRNQMCFLLIVKVYQHLKLLCTNFASLAMWMALYLCIFYYFLSWTHEEPRGVIKVGFLHLSMDCIGTFFYSVFTYVWPTQTIFFTNREFALIWLGVHFPLYITYDESNWSFENHEFLVHEGLIYLLT